MDILHLLEDNHSHALHHSESDSDLDAAQANTRHIIRCILEDHPCFGQVVRRSKDASNQTAEYLWYYEPSKDTNTQRRENYGGLVRSAQCCTLKVNQ
ncbi:target of SBF [Dispira simplex]|nr:target of SBF [Dispira simplex]